MSPANEQRSRLALISAIMIAVLAIFPLYWAFISALRPNEDILKYLSPLVFGRFCPTVLLRPI